MYRHSPPPSRLFAAALLAAAAPCSAEAIASAPLQCLTAAVAGALEPASAGQRDSEGQGLSLRFRPGSAELEPGSRSTLDGFLSCHQGDGDTPGRLTLRAEAGEREAAPGEALALANDRKDEVARRLRRAGVRFEVLPPRVLRDAADPARVELRIE